MADALTALDAINDQVAALNAAAGAGRTKTISVKVAQPIARSIAKTYFESVRSTLIVVQNREPLVEEIDFVIQALLSLASSPREREAYLGQLNELRPLLLEATVDLYKASGAPRLVLSDMERAILDTLTALLPITAASYEQALRDIAHGGRVSWRGTASELRETLREVIDHLGPDETVMASPGFRPEDNQTRPTQRQKVRYVLRARRSSSAAVAVAEASLSTVEETIALLARSTYQRGSASAHASATAKEVKSLKRYIDALLAELLEVS